MGEPQRSAREVVVFVGLQGSGKSSFYRQRLLRTHALVSKDAFPSARNKARRQAREILAALDAGRDVVVDNTNPTVAARAEIVAVASQRGARLVCYFFDSAFAACMLRNAARAGPARVPDVGLRATAKVLVPPSRAEGFGAIWYVRMNETGGFEVSAWEGA